MDFVAIDVETANPDMASICQVGIAGFQDGAVALEWCQSSPSGCDEGLYCNLFSVALKAGK